MKVSKAHKIISALLSLLVLVSTLSLTIEKHFCGDVLIDVAIFTESQKCAMEAYEIEQSKITKKSCCKDEVDIIEGRDDLAVKNFEDFDDIQKLVLSSYIYSYTSIYRSLSKKTIPHKDYSPPILIKDIQVLDETYLI